MPLTSKGGLSVATALAGVAAIAALAAAYYAFDPARAGFFPRCPFLMLTGWKCAGCGSQRAFHALLHLDFISAARSNLLLMGVLPLLALMGVASLLQRRLPRLYAALHSAPLVWALVAAIVVWTVARNALGM